MTIPGASCPGSARADRRAWPTWRRSARRSSARSTTRTSSTSSVVGFGAARRHITLSNLGNGGAYDDTSGVAMTMAEYQALLRWYNANDTYPSKTFKVALLDADAGRAKDGTYMREGSEYYAKNLIPKGPQGQYAMFAMMNANGASYPAYHFGTAATTGTTANGGVGAVAHVHHGHPVRAELALSGHVRRRHRGEQRRDRRVRRRPEERRDRRLRTAEREVQRLGQAGEPAPLRRTAGPRAARRPAGAATPTVPAYTASDQATYSPVHAGGHGPGGADPLHRGCGRRRSGARASRASASVACRTPTPREPVPSRRRATSIKATPVIRHTGGTSFRSASERPRRQACRRPRRGGRGRRHDGARSATGANFTAGQPFMVDTGQNLEVGLITAVERRDTITG